MATNDSVDAFSLLQNMAPMSYDSSRLIDVACIAFAGVSDKQLAVLRQAHRQTVIAQFAVRMTLPLTSLSAVLALAGVIGKRICAPSSAFMGQITGLILCTAWSKSFFSPLSKLCQRVIRHGSQAPALLKWSLYCLAFYIHQDPS